MLTYAQTWWIRFQLFGWGARIDANKEGEQYVPRPISEVYFGHGDSDPILLLCQRSKIGVEADDGFRCPKHSLNMKVQLIDPDGHRHWGELSDDPFPPVKVWIAGHPGHCWIVYGMNGAMVDLKDGACIVTGTGDVDTYAPPQQGTRVSPSSLRRLRKKQRLTADELGALITSKKHG